MRKSTKIRFIVFEILIDLFKSNKHFDELFEKKIKEYKLNNKEKSFIFNVSLNTMRYSLHSKIILSSYVKKKLKISQYILLASAITQIIFLNIKPYAVVNETVEVSKRIRLYSSFINGVLNNVVNDIKKLKQNTIIKKENLPIWFQNEIKKNKNINLKIFLDSYFFEPSLHIVFKSKKYVNIFKEEYDITSEKSLFIKSQKKVNEISNFKHGHWWIQNFSSMIPLALAENLKNKSILDLCAAPGGKAFQILSENKNIILNDKNKKRIAMLKENLSRLNYSAEIKNFDALSFPNNRKYDVIILDAPCSAIGTLRKNPEILFRRKAPDLKILSEKQTKLIEKASSLLNSNGMIIYMVCSFFFSETIEPFKKFLEKNKNFSVLGYNSKSNKIKIDKFISKEGYFLTAPTIYKNHRIDGFFSIQLIKND